MDVMNVVGAWMRRNDHGVFAPNSNHRALVTPAKRGKGSQKVADEQDEKTPA